MYQKLILKDGKILIIKETDNKKEESIWLILSSTNKVKVGDNIIAYIEGPIFYSNPLQATSKKIEIID